MAVRARRSTRWRDCTPADRRRALPTNATGSTADEIDVIDAAGLRVTEGIVTNIDKGHQKITVTYDNGKTEVFQLTPRAAAERFRIQIPPRAAR